MPELLILRHAEAENGTIAATDAERILSPRGQQDANHMGVWLAEHVSTPDVLIASTAERARRTMLAVCAGLRREPDQVRWDIRVYNASVGTLLAVLSECPPATTSVLLVGHNPGLEGLAAYLDASDTGNPQGQPRLPPAGLVHLQFEQDWQDLQPGCAQQLYRTQPY